MANRSPNFFPKSDLVSATIANVYTPFGVGLHHFALGLVYISPSLMQPIVNTDKKKEKRKGSHIPLSHEVL